MSTENLVHPELAGVEVHGMSRASFIMRGALAAGAVYGVGAVSPFVGSALAQTSTGDVDILNYALTLEYLETDFYQVKGASLKLSGLARAYAKDFGAEEAAHVAAIAEAIKDLGGTPVAMPKFSFPVTDQASFLKLASTVENLGVSAYNGAAPMISSKEVLGAAGTIVQVEARHAAAINLLIGLSPTPTQGFDVPKSKSQVLAAATPLIA
ncbi:MAG TPA: ferritin-like domain-containing protein [Solirubrobacteraceae bacterium]|jgi:hypothetical protein|nr:ferritin-like domain-containing protein [Solirubrobacteraceae bacterium]